MEIGAAGFRRRKRYTEGATVVIESGTLRTTSVPGDDPPSLLDRKLEGQDPENAVINFRHVMGTGPVPSQA